MNNGQISFSAIEAARALHISKTTSWRAFKNLINRGFIAIAKRSGFNLKRGQGCATEYRLTEFACNASGKPATFKFKLWRRGKNGSENISRFHQSTRSVSPEYRKRILTMIENTNFFPLSVSPEYRIYICYPLLQLRRGR